MSDRQDSRRQGERSSGEQPATPAASRTAASPWAGTLDTKLAVGLVAISILGAIVVRGWAASQWQSNFDSDEAIFGLMALHIHDGNFVPTVYGTRHLGSIESLLSAGLFSIFGTSILSFRLSALIMIFMFLVLHAWYVWRMWGRVPAILSTAFLAVPGFHILSWTYQPIGAYAALLLFGTGLLLLGSADFSFAGWQRMMLLGVVAGLGFWSNQMVIVYLMAVGLPAILASWEWSRLYRWASSFIERRIGLPAQEVMTIMVSGLGMTMVVAFFSGACQPTWQFQRAETIARGALAFAGLGVLLGMFIASARRLQLLLLTGSLGLGFLIGFSPLWSSWLTGAHGPVSVIRPSCPTGVISNTQLLVQQILPEIVGVRAVSRLWGLNLLQWGSWLFALSLSVLAVLLLLWTFRRGLWAIVPLRPIGMQKTRREVSLGVLFLLPIGLSVLGSNTVDIHSIRHLLVAWHASAILFGLFMSRIISNRSWWGTLLFAVWIGYLGQSNLSYAAHHWPMKFTRFDQEAVGDLETYLRERSVSRGYADYWGAYAIDFLAQESVLLAPYNGLNRIPSYASEVEAAQSKAIIFPLTWALEQGTSIAILENFLHEENLVSGEGAAYGRILDWIQEAQVVSREPIGFWDVWILED